MADAASLEAAASKAKKPKGGKRPPWARLLVATFLGYISTVIISAAITSVLPIDRAEATFMSLLLSGLVYVIIFLYVFAVKTWWRGLRDILIATLIAAAVLTLAKGWIF